MKLENNTTNIVLRYSPVRVGVGVGGRSENKHSRSTLSTSVLFVVNRHTEIVQSKYLVIRNLCVLYRSRPGLTHSLCVCGCVCIEINHSSLYIDRSSLLILSYSNILQDISLWKFMQSMNQNSNNNNHSVSMCTVQHLYYECNSYQ